MKTHHLSKGMAIAGGLFAFLLVLTALPADAATFNVTKTADTEDGTCDADCSLREAIREANDAGGDDIINVPAGTYTITRTGRGEDAAWTGDYDIEENLEIYGAGASTTIIDADELDRVFQVEGGVTFELHDVTVQNGLADIDATADGGGIYNDGTLSVYDCIIKNNTAAQLSGANAGNGRGGGIYNDGTVSMIDSTVFEGNVAVSSTSSASGTAFGGGLYNGASSTVTTIKASTFTENKASESTGSGDFAGYGGAVMNNGTLTTFKHSTLENNIAYNNNGTGDGVGNGGGLYNLGPTITTFRNMQVRGNTALVHNGTGTDRGYGGGIAILAGHIDTFRQVKIENNTAKTGSESGNGYGGGIYNASGVTTMDEAVFSGNVAVDYDGAGSSNGYGGGMYVSGGITTLSESTFSGNTAKTGSGGGDGYGGGLCDVAGEITNFQNSTVSGNTALLYEGSGPEDGYGGGIFNQASTSAYKQITVADNTALQNTGSGSGTGYAGGLYVNGGLIIFNSIIADNTDGNGTATTPDCYDSGSLNNNGYNIIGDTTGCSWPTATGDRTDTDPLLDVLQDNGGYTQTHGLLSGSLAMDQIPGGSCGLATDQRGMSRPQGDKCDMGAFEVDKTDPVVTLIGDAGVELLLNEEWNDPGATATDNFDGDLTDDITVINSVNTQKVGTTTLKYRVYDRQGNRHTVQRQVEVKSRGEVTNITEKTENRVKVKYEDGSTQTFTVFSQGTLKPRARLSKNGEHIVVIHRSGNRIKSIDANLGTVIASRSLYKNKQDELKFRIFNYYKDNTNNDVIITARRNNVLRTYHFFITKNGNLTNKDWKKYKSDYHKDDYRLIKREDKFKLRRERNNKLLTKYKVKKNGDLKEL